MAIHHLHPLRQACAPRRARLSAGRTRLALRAEGAPAQASSSAPGAPLISFVEEALSSNAQRLAAATPTAQVAEPPTQAADAATLLLQLVEEERRLAALETELAAVEAGLMTSDRALSLARTAPAAVNTASAQLQARLESTEAEAAVRLPAETR
jgi:hypothetical protein